MCEEVEADPGQWNSQHTWFMITLSVTCIIIILLVRVSMFLMFLAHSGLRLIWFRYRAQVERRVNSCRGAIKHDSRAACGAPPLLQQVSGRLHQSLSVYSHLRYLLVIAGFGRSDNWLYEGVVKCQDRAPVTQTMQLGRPTTTLPLLDCKWI